MLDSVVAQKAVNAVTPMVLHLMDKQLIEPQLKSIAVMVSRRRETTFDVVLSTYIGEAPCHWTYPHDEAALRETRVTARTGLPVQEVLAAQPKLIREDDVWRGRNATDGELIVSCSGVQPWFCWVTAWSVLGMIKALYDEHEWSAATDPEPWLAP